MTFMAAAGARGPTLGPTAKSETKLHCCMGWLYVGSVLMRVSVNVSPEWSAHITMDDTVLPGNKSQTLYLQLGPLSIFLFIVTFVLFVPRAS